MGNWLSPEEEAQLEDELNQINNRISSKQATTSPLLAQNLVDWRNRHPKAPMFLLVPTVQQFTNGGISEDQADKVLSNMTSWWSRTKAEKDSKSFWEKLYSGLKTGVRWTTAVSAYTNELFTNMVRAQWKAKRGGSAGTSSLLGPISPDFNPAGSNISTQLGTLIESPEKQGEGFFLSKELHKQLVDRQIKLGGLIDGHAVTFGKAFGMNFFKPGTREFSILSGLTDFTAAVAIPAVPGYKLGKTLTYAGLSKAGIATLQGLTDTRTGLIRPDRVLEFLNSRSGRRTIERMTKITSVDQALEAFPTADLEFLRNVSKIDDTNAMRQFVKDTLGLGNEALGQGPRSVEDINLSFWQTVKQNKLLQRESNVAKFMTSLTAKVSGGEVVVAGGSLREQLQSVKNVQNYLKTLRINPVERATIIDDLTNALLNDDGKMKQVATSVEKIVRRVFKESGVSQELEDQLLKTWGDFTTDFAQKANYGQINDAGTSADFGGSYPAVLDGKVVNLSQPLNMPVFQSEALRHSLMLPDFRRTRRLVSDIGWITGKAGLLSAKNKGKLRTPLAFIEWAQNYIWRPAVMMTGGFATRNMAESLIRMSFSDTLPVTPLHPLDYINVATYKRLGADIRGETFKAAKPSFKSQIKRFLDGDMPETFAESLLRAGQRELAQATSMSMGEIGPINAYSRQKVSGAWRRVARQDGKAEFTQGVAAEVALLASDPIARLVADGQTVDEIFATLMKDPNKRSIKNIQNLWKDVPVPLPDGTMGRASYKFFDEQGNVIESAVKEYIRTVAYGAVEATTGGNVLLKEIIANGGIRDADGNFVEMLKFDRARINEWDVGHVNEYTDAYWKTLSDIVDDPNTTLKANYKAAQSIDLNPDKKNLWNRSVDVFFGHLYPKREAFLSRSPAFRSAYYQTINELLDELAPGEVANIVNNLRKRAGELGKTYTENWLKNYVGQDLGERLLSIYSKNAPDTAGKLTLTQLDAYAKGYALDETKRLFFNAAEKSNFADVLRIVGPFGQAWAEASKYWGKLLATSPETMKRVSIGIQSLEGIDFNGDGKGMFYKDPATGEMMFAFPFGNEFAPFILGWGGLVTGGVLGGIPGALGLGAAGAFAGTQVQKGMDNLNVQWAAPVQSLNMAFGMKLPFGPAVQMAAWQILKDKPEFDQLRGMIAPYGKPQVVPSWANKAWEAISKNPESDRIYADLKLEMIRALQASGEYDTSTQEGKLELEKDAADRAGTLLMLQSIGQFAGPMRPSPEAVIKTKQGDVLASYLSQQWREMYKENPDTAVVKFLDTFGDDAFMYMQSKSKTDFGGLEFSREFANWEAKNKDLFRKYPEVAGFFAPSGTEFDQQVFIRSMELRYQPLDGQDFIDLAQAKVGMSLYRAAVRRAGPKPNAQQRQVLRDYRKQLEDMFTGFRDAKLDVNKQDTQINMLYEAANDPALNNNPIAEGLRTYLQFRDQAMNVAKSYGLSSLSGDRMADVRESLRRVGEDLSARIPEFERLWNRVLFNEVDII